MDAEIQELVERLAARLERGVSAGDSSMTTFAYSKQPADVDGARIASLLDRRTPLDVVRWAQRERLRDASGPVRTDSYPPARLKDRIWAPIRFRGAFLGFMSVIDDGHLLPDSALADIAAVAERIGELLYEESMALEVAAKHERRLVAALLGEDPTGRQRAAVTLRDQEGTLSENCFVIVAVVPDDFPKHHSVAVARAPGWPSCTRLFPLGEAWVMVANADPAAPHGAANRLAARLLDTLERLGHDDCGGSIGLGVGDCVPLDEAGRSHQRALDAIRAARTFPQFWPIALWDELGPYRVFTAATHVASAARLDEMLERLRLCDPHGAFLTTLEAYLACAGDAQATAKLLHLHRTSLYYRLNRIEEITGASLRDGEDRLRLHVAVKMARLTDQPPHAGRPADPPAVLQSELGRLMSNN